MLLYTIEWHFGGQKLEFLQVLAKPKNFISLKMMHLPFIMSTVDLMLELKQLLGSSVWSIG